MVAAWVTVATIGLVIMLFALGRIAQNLRPDPELRGLPITPLERLGWIGLATSAGVTVGIAVLVAVFGVDGFHEQPVARLTFWVLLMVGVAVWALAWRIVKRRSGGIVVDERDRAVLARSFSVESMVVLLSLVAWTVSLTEVFWDEGSVPIAWLQLLFWTTFVGGAMGRSLGIILGYRRGIAVDA